MRIRIFFPIFLFITITEYGQSFDGFYNIQSTCSTHMISEKTDENRFSLSHTFFANHSESFSIFNTSINANAFGKIKSGEDQEADKTKSKFESKITEFYISMGSDSFFFDIGKKHIKTGTALFKSPTYYFDSVSGSTWKRE